MHGRKTFITRHPVIHRRSDLIIPHLWTAIVQSKSFAYVGPSDWTWNYCPCHIYSRRDDLRPGPSRGGERQEKIPGPQVSWGPPRYSVLNVYSIDFCNF